MQIMVVYLNKSLIEIFVCLSSLYVIYNKHAWDDKKKLTTKYLYNNINHEMFRFIHASPI